MAENKLDLDFTDYKRRMLAEHLQKHMDGEIRFDAASRRLYSTDASIYQIEPLGVVIPRTVEALHTAVQITAEMRVPIVPRGGGTSLSGQSIGRGVVIDCSKYLHGITAIDPEARLARVQPGVVLDQLNRAVAPHGLQFGPDVATASRANLGGMIGNNSAGARSVVHGKTIDHVRRLDVILADGSRAELGPAPVRDWESGLNGSSLVEKLCREVRQVAVENAAEIHRRFPKILRRVSGYNLDVFADAFAPAADAAEAEAIQRLGGGPAVAVLTRERTGAVGLHQLVVGSEGTLAFVAGAELNLVPRPKCVGLVVPHFSSLAAATDAVGVCLDHAPSAVELLDRQLLQLARGNLLLRHTMDMLEGSPASLLMVELSDDDPVSLAGRMERLRRRLQGLPGVTAVVAATDAAVRDPLWNLRRATMPLLLGVPGDRKPVTFVEDTAVAPEVLPEFVARFQEVLRDHGTTGAFYGHASVGCLHIRPVLNLKDADDVQRMRRITEDVTDLVLEFGGALTGEHGDGLARSEWNRKMFGEPVYQAFCRVKQAFDPHNLFNPGKVVHAPPMTDDLRTGPGYRARQPLTLFDYSAQGGFAGAVEMCNGNGACRKREGGAMCPSFRATLDEHDSTRGRANALRLALSAADPARELRGRWLYDVLDLCLMCKACKSECPSNVDMTKLKAEFLHLYHQRRLRPPGQALTARVHRVYQLASWAPRTFNRLGRSRLARWLMEKAAGIDRRRSLPPLQEQTFRRWFHGRTPPAPGGRGTVLLLDDCFTNYTDTGVGRAAVRVLEATGYSVELVGPTCCGRPLIGKGLLRQARDLIAQQARLLAGRLEHGTVILGLEPSCLLTLADEWPELVPGQATRAIAAAGRLLEDWLAEQARSGLPLPLRPRAGRCVVHGHCHQKALVGTAGTRDALKLIPGLDVEVLQTGCCGMAGSFGYERKHYDLSVSIANLDLLPALEDNPGAAVVAPGTSCRHQIRDLAGGRTAVHPVELLAEQLDQE